MSNKVILDACCGGRMMWFEKNHPNALYIDNRLFEEKLTNGQNFKVKPDLIMDFRDLKFPDKKFKLVVFDPPHIHSFTSTAWMGKKYGILNKDTWQEDIKKGFDECWRVLADDGILIFKWSTEAGSKSRSITTQQVLDIIKRTPLFGHPTARNGNTIWMCFMKINI